MEKATLKAEQEDTLAPFERSKRGGKKREPTKKPTTREEQLAYLIKNTQWFKTKLKYLRGKKYDPVIKAVVSGEKPKLKKGETAPDFVLFEDRVYVPGEAGGVPVDTFLRSDTYSSLVNSSDKRPIVYAGEKPVRWEESLKDADEGLKLQAIMDDPTTLAFLSLPSGIEPLDLPTPPRADTPRSASTTPRSATSSPRNIALKRLEEAPSTLQPSFLKSRSVSSPRKKVSAETKTRVLKKLTREAKDRTYRQKQEEKAARAEKAVDFFKGS